VSRVRLLVALGLLLLTAAVGVVWALSELGVCWLRRTGATPNVPPTPPGPPAWPHPVTVTFAGRTFASASEADAAETICTHLVGAAQPGVRHG
jgi:hypothetical protein